MPAALLATIPAGQAEEENLLIMQVGRWKIKGRVSLVFFARESSSKHGQSKICVKFKSSADAKEFIDQFKTERPEYGLDVIFDLLTLEKVPDFDALSVPF